MRSSAPQPSGKATCEKSQPSNVLTAGSFAFPGSRSLLRRERTASSSSIVPVIAPAWAAEALSQKRPMVSFERHVDLASASDPSISVPLA